MQQIGNRLLLYITSIWAFDVLKTEDKESPYNVQLNFNKTKREEFYNPSKTYSDWINLTCLTITQVLRFVISLLDTQASLSFFKTSS